MLLTLVVVFWLAGIIGFVIPARRWHRAHPGRYVPWAGIVSWPVIVVLVVLLYVWMFVVDGAEWLGRQLLDRYDAYRGRRPVIRL